MQGKASEGTPIPWIVQPLSCLVEPAAPSNDTTRAPRNSGAQCWCVAVPPCQKPPEVRLTKERGWQTWGPPPKAQWIGHSRVIGVIRTACLGNALGSFFGFGVASTCLAMRDGATPNTKLTQGSISGGSVLPEPPVSISLKRSCAGLETDHHPERPTLSSDRDRTKVSCSSRDPKETASVPEVDWFVPQKRGIYE